MITFSTIGIAKYFLQLIYLVNEYPKTTTVETSEMKFLRSEKGFTKEDKILSRIRDEIGM